jgi:hypothetical protein
MALTIHEVKSDLEQDGLYVSLLRGDRLWIAADVQLNPQSLVPFSKNICILESSGNDRWVARFVLTPPFTCDVGGSLSELHSLVRAVFGFYHSENVSLRDAFAHVIGDPDDYGHKPLKG